MAFKILNRENIYKGRVFELQRLNILLPDERQASYDIISHPGAVTLVPVDNEGNILFVRQFRVAVDREMLELPAGTLNPGEKPEICAAREIREETGMAAKSIIKIGEFFLAPGYSSEHMHIFLATGLYPNPLDADDDEFLQVEKIPISHAYEMAISGEIQDGKSIASLLLAQAHLVK